MPPIFLLNVFPISFAALIAVLLAAYIWSYRHAHPSARALFWLVGDVLLWLIGYLVEILGGDIAAKEAGEIIITVSQAFIGPLWLIFAVQYTGWSGRFLRLSIPLFLLPAVLTTALALTNSQHHLLWSGVTLSNAGPFVTILTTPEIGFWALAVYRYIYVIAGTGFVLLALVRSAAWYQRGGALIALGGLLPLVGNSLHIFNLIRVFWIDVGPFAFLLASLLLAIALFAYRLSNLIPMAQRHIFESMRQGVIVIDNEGKLVDINPAARQMLNWSPNKNLREQRATRVLPASWLSYLRRPTEGENEFSIGSGNSARWVTLSVSPLTENQGRELGRLLVLNDTTEAHMLAELRNDLVQMMVHDLRNPLSVVYGSVELLTSELGEKLDERGQKLLNMARLSTNQCLEIVNRILDLQLLESGQIVPDQKPLSAEQAIQQAVQQMSPLADGKKIEMGADVSADLPPAQADPKLLERILQNLIGNAIKFTPTMGRVRVGARAADHRVQVWVSDTGIGIPADLQTRLFQKFVTGNSPQKGSGLGLAFCKLAVEAQGGRIWVESKEGQGSTFYFTLPLAQSN
jgi:PAS domain S-box-containing protein